MYMVLSFIDSCACSRGIDFYLKSSSILIGKIRVYACNEWAVIPDVPPRRSTPVLAGVPVDCTVYCGVT